MNRFEFYKDHVSKWRWRIKSTSNGQTVGSSGESFSTKQAAVNNAKLNGYSGEGKRNILG